MMRVLLINPNSSRATTDMMVSIARSTAPAAMEIVGATARRGPPMIVDPAALSASAIEVAEIGARLADDFAGIIISAFGDPGLAELRRELDIPVVGIAESAMLKAARGERRFGIATTTPALVAAVDAKVAGSGFAHLYTGVRLAPGDPLALVADPDRLIAALADAVSECLERDQAEAVIIGGGPLGNAATALASRFNVPVIAPIPAAVGRLSAMLGISA